jgi:hypothetical protein
LMEGLKSMKLISQIQSGNLSGTNLKYFESSQFLSQKY